MSMSKICVIEDDKGLAEIYQTLLTTAGFTVVVANDGAAGLKLVEDTLPDLVLLDLMLPELSGYDVLKGMRTSEWGRDIKVIMLTNISETEAPDGIEQLGFSRYIVKANLVSNKLPDICTEVISEAPQDSVEIKAL